MKKSTSDDEVIYIHRPQTNSVEGVNKKKIVNKHYVRECMKYTLYTSYSDQLELLQFK
jgi:hypothetical protein